MHIFPVKIIPRSADAQWECPPLPDSSAKKLLIISRPVADGSAAEATLRKMMAACQLQPGDYELLFFEESQAPSWQCLAAAGAAKTILLLGVDPRELAIQAVLQPYQPNDFGGKTFIPSASLDALERDAASKKALWQQGLKPAFGL